MKRFSFTFLLTFFTVITFACLNEYRTRLNGESVTTFPSSGAVRVSELDTTQIRIESLHLLDLYNETDSIEYLSDYAAKLVYLGEYEKAKNIYFQIESILPNLYTTASNLGTIYELIGMPDSGLVWIQKSIDINPESHQGSEWVHIKILEFQIAQSEDYSRSILGLDFGEKSIPENLNNVSLDKLRNDIHHQLRERLQFVKPENEIVGNIYFDYGNILALTADLEAALEGYSEAEKFGFKSELMTVRILKFESMTSFTRGRSKTWSFIKHNLKEILISVLIALILFPIVIVWLYRRRKKRIQVKE